HPLCLGIEPARRIRLALVLVEILKNQLALQNR
ncbi:hypothetical protein D047_3920B, partial [Vibrio parahaemolyticus VPTS-2010_2]